MRPNSKVSVSVFRGFLDFSKGIFVRLLHIFSMKLRHNHGINSAIREIVSYPISLSCGRFVGISRGDGTRTTSDPTNRTTHSSTCISSRGTTTIAYI